MLAKLIHFLATELLWLFGALVAAALLSACLSKLIKQVTVVHKSLEADLNNQLPLNLVLFVVCLAGVYISRMTWGALDTLFAPQTAKG